jgi:hypothetical protein
MNTDRLKTLVKSEVTTLSKNLDAGDIRFLIQTLNEKDDVVRYNAFLLLQSSSRESPFVYEYWSDLEEKLENPNSYQRSLGIMLIAENVKWDRDDRLSKTISKYLRCCNDEKFITARQAIQGLETIVKATDKFNNEIKQSLASLQFSQYKENQQKLVNKDVSNVLKTINSRMRT